MNSRFEKQSPNVRLESFDNCVARYHRYDNHKNVTKLNLNLQYRC